jgi:pyrroloquinoline quinone biosynthesis protein B
VRFLVLGSAAGGGFPQWNCLCPNCRLAWERDPRAERRSQASLAVSRDGQNWILLGASPDLRQQILETPALQPRHAPRHTPIRGVYLLNGDIDNIAGLLVMREMQPFTIWGSEATLAHVSGGVFAAVNAKFCPRTRVFLDERLDTGLGFTLTPFAVPGKIPLYMEPNADSALALGVEGETTVGLEIEGDGRRAYYIPSCARMTGALRARLDGADLLFFDGTTYEDDEMIRLGLSHKTAWRMGHMAMNGARGTIAELAGVRVGEKYFIHVNNSNPALCRGAPERERVEAAGWRVAHDGLAVDLGAQS